MQYRRVFIEGGCYFFTLALADRNSDLLVREIDCLRAAFKTVKRNHPFEINAIVVMPDHLHCLWTLPPNDCDYPTRWSLIKASFSRRIPKNELINTSRLKRSERAIWQRRFWEHTIRDERDFYNHIEYIHHNPVKHGYVSNAQDWPYSSIHLFTAPPCIITASPLLDLSHYVNQCPLHRPFRLLRSYVCRYRIR